MQAWVLGRGRKQMWTVTQDGVVMRHMDESEWEEMSLKSARVYIDTARVSHVGYYSDDILAKMDEQVEASECLEWLKRTDGSMVLALSGSNLIGYAAYCRNTAMPKEYDWSLEGFYVLPEWQSRHIGTRLLRLAVETMLDLGGSKLLVSTFRTSPACEYYLRKGAVLLFETVQEVEGKPNIIAILGWDLDELVRYLTWT